MKFSFRFIFVIFYVTAVLLFAVYLRSAESRIFYKVRRHKIQQGRLKQQLWQKQLQLENLISPSTVSEQLDY